MDNESSVTLDKMYFANNNGKIPKDANGNIVLTKDIIDATICAAFDQFNDSKVAMACKEFMQYKDGTNKHVIMVHGDDSLTEPEEMDCVGTIYSVTLSEPIEFRYHGHRGFGKCQYPELYTVEEEALKDAKIEKMTTVSFKATFEYEKSLTMQHATEDLSQENFGVKDDRFVKDVILPSIKDNTLYHGSSQKLSVIKPFLLKELRDKNVKTISLTPYARLASLFCVPFRSIRENSKGQVIFHHCRMKLDEWFEDMPEEEMYKAVQTVHISHNIKQLAPIDKTYTGYLHYVNAEDALVDAGANPINGKGPYEVVSYVKDLKPYKVESIKIRMIAKYSPSFAKECGLDAEPCEPEDVATEDLSIEPDTSSVISTDLDVAVELLQEFNAGIEEFHHWARDLELYYLKQRFQDPQVEMVYSQIAQENILVNTVKEIFKKIAQFIAWFFKKLKDLWNYFFGRMQRKIRLYKSLRDTTKKYLASNAYFNEKAFRDYPAPTGMVVIDEMLAMMDEAWAPDKLHAIFKEIFDLWEKDPMKLHDIITIDLVVQKQAHRFWPLVHTGYGNGVGKGIQDVMLKLFPAKGTIYEAGLTSLEDVDEYCKSIDTALTAYLDITKLFSAHGDIMTQAQRRILDYADRTDITEKEASEMANKVKALSGILKNLTDVYTKSFEFILGQGIMVMETAHKFLKK